MRLWVVWTVTVLLGAVGLTWCFWVELHGNEESIIATVRNLVLVFGSIWAAPLGIWRLVLAERRLLNERYQNGAEMLGSDFLSVRLGGIYSLRKLAEDYPKQYHVEAMNIFCAFVRHPPEDKTIAHSEKNPIFNLRPDVEAVVEAIRKRSKACIALEKKRDFKLNLQTAFLEYASFAGADLSNAILDYADLTLANLGGADLSNATFEAADLSNAGLDNADLTRANLEGAVLRGATLSLTKLEDAVLTQTQLDEARRQFDRPRPPPRLTRRSRYGYRLASRLAPRGLVVGCSSGPRAACRGSEEGTVIWGALIRTIVFLFLWDPSLDATNWRAEQAIRPAVVVRKVCGGNRTRHGADTQQVLASVVRTARQRDLDLPALIATMLRATNPIVPEVLALPPPPA